MNLTEWIRRKDQNSSEEALEALKARLGSLSGLPTLPEAATKAMAIAKDPNSSLGQLAAVIERDPAMAAGILKLANSPLYRTKFAVESLKHAVVKLGTRECQNVILAVGMRSIFRKVPRNRQIRSEGLWRHSFLTACLCRQINTTFRLGYDGEEFASGLSHDIGRVLFGVGAPDLFDQADPMDYIEGPDQLSRELQILGTDHCYLGAWFAEHSNLPAPLVNAVQFHHAPHMAVDHRPLVALVATADHMANHFQRFQETESYNPEDNPHWPILAAHVSQPEAFEEFASEVLAEAVQEANQVVGSAA